MALESRIPELSKHIWHYMVDTKFEGENLPRKCNDEHGISLYLGQLTSSPSKKYNSSCRAPNDALPKALESRHPEVSKNIWHYIVNTKFEGENLPQKCNDEHGINLY